MKNILLYTDTPQVGGAELQIFLLAKFLDKQNFNPILAVSQNPSLDKWVHNFEKENLRVIRVPVTSKHDPRHYTELKKIIHAENIDLIHAHIWNPASCRYVFPAAKHTNTPLITTEHDPFRLSPIKNIYKKYSFKIPRRIITVSQQNAETLKQLYPQHADKISVIHNGIDFNWWQSQLLRFDENDRHRLKTQLFHAKENTLIITTVAELNLRKGQNHLIEALPEVVQEYPNVKLVLVGDGPVRESYQKMVARLNLERHITFTGRQKDVPQVLKSSDIFVLPSIREAFGLAILEAMYAELPVIASKTGGIPEIITDKKNGLLVEPGNPESLAKALRKLITSEAARQELALAGKAHALENFDARKMAQEYEKTYSEITP